MAIDLTGGLPEERDLIFATRPGPEVRDACNIWLEEENAAFAMRIGVEALAEHWTITRSGWTSPIPMAA